MKMSPCYLGTKVDKSIMNTLKVDTWLYGVEKSAFVEIIGTCVSASYRLQCSFSDILR